MLHNIFQKTGMTPDEFYAKPREIQKFIVASMRVSMEKEGE